MDSLSADHGVVMYEGKAYSIQDLMRSIQEYIQDATERLNRVAFLVGELQKTVENTQTIEVKLSLSKEEYQRFKSLQGEDDRERILQAIRAAIQPALKNTAETPVPSVEPIVASLAYPKTESVKELKNPGQALMDELSVSVAPIDEPRPSPLPAARKKPSVKCPRCNESLDIPDLATSRLPMEIKCTHCGAKCLVKSKANAGKPEKSGFDPLDNPNLGNIFDMLST